MNLSRETLQQLITAAAQGDHDCFARLYDRTHVHLFSIAKRMLGNTQAAEDVLQEAFVNIWRSANSYQADTHGNEGHAMAWLIAIVRNKSLDSLRKRTRLKEDSYALEDTESSFSASPEQVAAQTDHQPSALDLLTQVTDAAHMGDCMRALDGAHRQSLALAYYQGLSHGEVAAQMGAPLGSVKAWIRRGLAKLKDCLATRGTA